MSNAPSSVADLSFSDMNEGIYQSKMSVMMKNYEEIT